MEELDIELDGTPFERRTMLNSIARRGVVCIGTSTGKTYEVIVSALYRDKGTKWLQGINLEDIYEGSEDPDLSNVIVNLSTVSSVELLDTSLYDIKMDPKVAGSIMQRTDTVVKIAKQIILGDEYDENYENRN